MSPDAASLPDDLGEAAAALAAIGVGVMGVAEHPAGAAVVFASAGPALWRAVARGPRRPDPVDALVRDALGPFVTTPGRRWVRVADDVEQPVDARALAVAAGLGWPSRLGLVLHPTHGPWLGLRAVCFVDAPLTPTGPLAGAGPCPTCDAPCARACPPEALPATGWRADRCLPFQAHEARCHGGCLARLACPVGASARHAPDQRRYHQHPPSRGNVLEALWR